MHFSCRNMCHDWSTILKRNETHRYFQKPIISNRCVGKRACHTLIKHIPIYVNVWSEWPISVIVCKIDVSCYTITSPCYNEDILVVAKASLTCCFLKQMFFISSKQLANCLLRTNFVHFTLLFVSMHFVTWNIIIK